MAMRSLEMEIWVSFLEHALVWCDKEKSQWF